jgi:hypothetical protein
MNPKRLTRSAVVALGLLTVAWPLAWAPPWTYPVAVLGAAAVLVTANWGPALAVAAAVISCAASHAPVAVLAVEGLVILGYLLLTGAPPTPGRWLRGQLPLVAAGALAGATALAAFAVRPSGSAWLAGAGLAAAVAAYLVAVLRPGKSTPEGPDDEHLFRTALARPLRSRSARRYRRGVHQRAGDVRRLRGPGPGRADHPLPRRRADPA